MLSDELKALKERSHKKNRDIAEETGIPESAVSKIICGQTDNPSFANVRDIVICLGGSLDEIVGIQHHIEQNSCSAESYEQEINTLKAVIESKGKWILRLFALLVCAAIIIVIFVIIAIIMHITK